MFSKEEKKIRKYKSKDALLSLEKILTIDMLGHFLKFAGFPHSPIFKYIKINNYWGTFCLISMAKITFLFFFCWGTCINHFPMWKTRTTYHFYFILGLFYLMKVIKPPPHLFCVFKYCSVIENALYLTKKIISNFQGFC